MVSQGSNHGYQWLQRQLSALYMYGEGVVQDHAKALTWFHKAAKQGYASAQYNIVLQYNHCHGVAQASTRLRMVSEGSRPRIHCGSG